jgi:serine/threonine protein kinase
MIQVHSYSFKKDYKKEDRIGSGTYGIVHRVRHLETGKQYAAKIFINSYIDLDHNIIEELNILRLVNSLGHQENIIYPLCIYICKKIVVILPLVDQNLYVWCKKKKQIPKKTIKIIIFQILKALFHFHSLGILHRDVKSTNILIDSNLRIYLIDYGMSKIINNCDSYLESKVQTPPYRAPELYLQSHKYGVEIDIWALGCIMAEMLIGNYLFGVQTKDIIHNQWSLLKSVPDIEVLSKLPEYELCKKKFSPLEAKDLVTLLKEKVSSLSIQDDEIEILGYMLELDPRKRWDTKKLLQHTYFDECRSIYPIMSELGGLKINWLETNQYQSPSCNFYPFQSIYKMYDYILGLWHVYRLKNWIALYSAFDTFNRVLMWYHIHKQPIYPHEYEKIASTCCYLSMVIYSARIPIAPKCSEKEIYTFECKILSICEFQITIPTIGHFIGEMNLSKKDTTTAYKMGILYYLYMPRNHLAKNIIANNIGTKNLKFIKMINRQYKYYSGYKYQNIKQLYNSLENEHAAFEKKKNL